MSYEQLQADIIRTLKRTDLSDDVPRFIRLCEAGIDRKLWGADREKTETLTTTDGKTTLPSDYRKLLNIQVAGTDLLGVDRQRFDNLLPLTGPPAYYLIKGENLVFHPMPEDGTEVKIVYSGAFTRLSDEEPTNWVLERFEDVYLYGSILHSAPILQDDERISMWAALYTTAVAEANTILEREAETPVPQRQPNGPVV